MPDNIRVLRFEKQLGFLWEWGMSRNTAESNKVPAVKRLREDIDKAKARCVTILPRELRRSANFQNLCRKLFERHARHVWPPPPADRSAWLVDATENNWDGLYVRNLYFGEHDNE